MLHKIDTKGWEEHTAWCVPTAISFLTGAPLIHTHSRAAMMQNISISKVKGMHIAEAILLLNEQGYHVKELDLRGEYENNPPTLQRFIRDRTGLEIVLPLMISIEDSKDFCHMITSHFAHIADNHTMKPVPVNEYVHRRKWVCSAHIVMKK